MYILHIELSEKTDMLSAEISYFQKVSLQKKK